MILTRMIRSLLRIPGKGLYKITKWHKPKTLTVFMNTEHKQSLDCNTGAQTGGDGQGKDRVKEREICACVYV